MYAHRKYVVCIHYTSVQGFGSRIQAFLSRETGVSYIYGYEYISVCIVNIYIYIYIYMSV